MWLIPVAAMSAGLALLGQLVGMPFHLSPWSMLWDYGYKALRVLPLVAVAVLAVQAWFAVREAPRTPLPAFVGRLRACCADPGLLLARVLPLLLMPIVFVGFSSLKMIMPRFVPFWLDDYLAAFDRTLFLGHQPWELTHAIFGSVLATEVIDTLYRFWVVLLSIAIVVVALFAKRADRARFFLAFTLIWVLLGVCGAWIGASAGPCYGALIGAASAPEFTGLVDRLTVLGIASQGSISAPSWEAMLWRSHSEQVYAFGMGISAMPSLHNAIAMLYALAAFRIGTLFGRFMTGYAVIIFIGSIHLGWHYAPDGIVAVLGAYFIWRWVDGWCRRSGYDAAVAASR